MSYRIRQQVSCAFLLCWSLLNLPAQFVAYNDHLGASSSPARHPFVTTYSFDNYSGGTVGGQGASNVVQGPLRDFANGEFLPVQVRIHAVGPLSPSFNSFELPPESPAAMIFPCDTNGVCLANFRDYSARVYNGRFVTNTFLGLNPARKYQFIGTGIFLGISNDTTRYTLVGALSFTNAHTSNCVVSATYIPGGIYLSNAVIVPTGRNHEPGFGDMAVWNDIRVGSNGSFSVVSSAEYGIGTPINAFRLVEDFVEPTAPSVDRQPANVIASRGGSSLLAPVVSGSLPLSFQWLKDGAPVLNATNRVLRFTPLQPEHAGEYSLAVTNPFGFVLTSNATVVVENEAIGIAAHPQSLSLRAGESMYLFVNATGTPPHFFQWFKNGAAIPGATSNLFGIGAVSAANAGGYSVLASNLFSSAESSTAVVTVAESPLRIIDQPQSVTVTQGTTLLLQVAVAGTAPRFRWYKNGNGLANGTNPVVRVAAATTNDAGNYLVIATNRFSAVTSLVASVSVVPGPTTPQPPGIFTVLSLTNHVWAYDQSGLDLGTAWRETNFSDESWLTGRGVLAREDNAAVRPLTNTVLRLRNDANQPIITSYFRTHFFWPTSTIGAVLQFSNLIDDGAAFYLNGVPLFRQNLPDGNVSYSTLAPAPALEGAFVVTNVAAPMIAEGDNVLAVELHQNSPNSSDNVFGTAVFGYRLPEVPLSILAEPSGQTIHERESLSLTFKLNAPAAFQWFHNGQAVDGARHSQFHVQHAVPLDSGEYFAIATNSYGAVTSAVVTVQVIPDAARPRVIIAILQTNRATILVNFDEPLLFSSATNPAHFRVHFWDDTEAGVVLSASYSNAQIVLTLANALPPETNLVLWLNGIRDIAVAGNEVNEFRTVLRQLLPLLPIEGVWKYEDSGNDLGHEWRQPDYDDANWPEGPALFYNDSNWIGQPGGDLPPAVANTNTLVQITNSGLPILTHYFRTKFNFPASPLGAQLSLRTVIDDGALLYLNGVEFLRIGMPAGVITATNLASRVRGTGAEGQFEGPFVSSMPELVWGENVLAAEVHQGNFLFNTDVSFGIEVMAIATSFPNEPVMIVNQPSDVTVREGEPFRFAIESLAATSAQWFRSGSPLPAFTEVLSVPRALLSDNGARFFVVLSNQFGTLTSSEATLTVLADTNSPLLLFADANQSLTTITLAFSEPLDPLSIADLAQYTVHSSDGRSIEVTGAVLMNETNVLLATAPRRTARTYEVRVSGVRDNAQARNEVAPGSGATVGFTLVAVPLTAIWRYDQSGNGQVQSWKSVEFDDSEWSLGQALLYNDTFATGAPAVPLSTVISQTNSEGHGMITHYFRHAFEMPSLESNAVLRLRHAVDDGAAFYLNGVELLRTNLPAGPLHNATFASSSIGDARVNGPVPVPIPGMPGPAVLAAELHQATTFPGDLAFAAELSISFESTLLPPSGPSLRVRRLGDQLELSWFGSDYGLEGATDVSGPWSAVAGSSPRSVSTSGTNMFFRLRKF